MFGYVSPQKSELKMRELAQYQAWYCGLCKTLRREYGQLPRLSLSYDCTFLALLLAALAGEEPMVAPARCGYKPFRKAKLVAENCPALEYAADCNVLLYWYKLADDWRDEKKLLGVAGRVLLRRGAKKAQVRQAELAQIVQTQLQALAMLEQQACEEVDVPADAFAKLLQALAVHYPPLSEEQRQVVGQVGYHLGRWLYFADACDDRARDQKSGAYNPFVTANADRERISFLLYSALYEMENAFDLLQLQTNGGLIENIVYMGCRAQTKRLLEEMEE